MQYQNCEFVVAAKSLNAGNKPIAKNTCNGFQKSRHTYKAKLKSSSDRKCALICCFQRSFTARLFIFNAAIGENCGSSACEREIVHERARDRECERKKDRVAIRHHSRMWSEKARFAFELARSRSQNKRW